MSEAVLFTPVCVDLLRSGQAVRFSATGGSMHPTIRDGETIVVQPIDAEAVRRNDVLLYGGRRGLTAHRVVRVVGEGCPPGVFVVRGDNGGGLDEYVDHTRVLGRVSSVERSDSRRDPASSGALLAARAWHGLVRVRGLLRSLTTVMRLEWPRTRRRHRNAG